MRKFSDMMENRGKMRSIYEGKTNYKYNYFKNYIDEVVNTLYSLYLDSSIALGEKYYEGEKIVKKLDKRVYDKIRDYTDAQKLSDLIRKETRKLDNKNPLLRDWYKVEEELISILYYNTTMKNDNKKKLKIIEDKLKQVGREIDSLR